MELRKKMVNFANVTKLDRHIEILLLENDCVIVPGLGGFVAHHVDARYDEQDGLFLPPYRTLGFNPQLTMNDSLLVQSYIAAYDLSYPEALQQIENEVDEIYHTLENEGALELNDLGRLSTNAEKKLEFEPFESGILTPPYYGLSSFDFPLLKPKIQSPAQPAMPSHPVRHGMVYIDTANGGERRISISMRVLRDMAVAAVLLIAVLLIAFPTPNRNGLPEQQIKSGMFYNIFDSSDTPNVSAQFKPMRDVGRAANVSAHYWAIVMASHVTENNAKLYASQLQDRGFKEARVYEGSGSIKVLYGHFPSQEEAYAQLKSLNGSAGFKDAWIIEIGK
ncbi:MAG: SPOR domain-containing protein [Prevotella sp.]|nr:SPOR domain-containing protein [Prevotella sp.]